jgi:DNA-binding response OmpR family regulator
VSRSDEAERARKNVFILLIEDNPGDVGLVREALEVNGVDGELLVAADGDRAIEFIQALDTDAIGCPDLVIVDLNLPKRSGREVLKRMRESVKCRETTVVILSSSDAQQDRADAVALGASSYFKKPLRLQEFLKLGAIFSNMIEASRDK